MKIENMKKVELGSVKAFFDIDFDKMKIRRFKLICQQGQKMWASSPDEKYTDKSGKTAYKKIVEITDVQLMGKISLEAIAEYNK